MRQFVILTISLEFAQISKERPHKREAMGEGSVALGGYGVKSLTGRVSSLTVCLCKHRSVFF